MIEKSASREKQRRYNIKTMIKGGGENVKQKATKAETRL
jgi:hypothetical protein